LHSLALTPSLNPLFDLISTWKPLISPLVSIHHGKEILLPISKFNHTPKL
jgi:hypothetical protein